MCYFFLSAQNGSLVVANDKNLTKVQKMCNDSRMCLIAIDEAHLMYDWQDFRQLYKRCGEVHIHFPGVPVMALSATRVV
jgi:bloom syndrome protein